MDISKRSQRKKQTTAGILHAAATLFLEKGYHDTSTAEIAKAAGVTEGVLFRRFHDKEKLLLELVHMVFHEQFTVAERLTAGIHDPALMYALETALQFYITDRSEPLRDIYLAAYTLPSTTEYIYENTALKLHHLFGANFPDYEQKDFLELEYASGGVTRSFMAQPCTVYFTIEQKINRFLEAVLRIYRVPEARIGQLQAAVHQYGLDVIAQQLVDGIIERAKSGAL